MSLSRRSTSGPQVWVLGAHGMLGLAVFHAFVQTGSPVVGLTRRHLDASEVSADALELRAGDVVLNCIGMINRRVAAGDEAQVLRINALWPRRLADHCQRQGAHLIHISTDCVFSGLGAPHDEGAAPDAQDLYGRSKAWGEPANALVVRSSIVGPELRHHHSLMCWVLGHAHGSELPGYANHLWNGMTTLQMARCLVRLVELGEHRRPGLVHLHSDTVSKFELVSLLSRKFRPDLRVLEVMAGTGRDMRLGTVDPARLARLEVPALVEQVEALGVLSDPQGRWTGEVA